LRACIKESTVDMPAYIHLREDVSLTELLLLQDVAAREGDLAWQMSEFRRHDKPAAAGTGAPLSGSQQASKAKLLAGMPTVDPAAIRNAVAEAKQAQAGAASRPKAAPVRVGRRGENGD